MTQSDGMEDQENSEDTLARLGSPHFDFDIRRKMLTKNRTESKIYSELPEWWIIGRSL